jgi:hypothetical protein
MTNADGEEANPPTPTQDGPKGTSRVYGYGPIPERQDGRGSRWSVGGLKNQGVLWSEGLSPFAGEHKPGDKLTLTVGVPEVAGYTLHRVKSGYGGGSESWVYSAGGINVHLYGKWLGELMGPDGEYPAMVVASLPLRGTPVTTAAAATEVKDPVQPADDLVVRTTELVKQFRQVILYGPPGTGKTRLARQVALSLLDPARATPDVLEDSDLLGDALKTFSGEPEHSFDLVVFHPSYEYEQFIGGITANTSGGILGYAVEEGVFLRLCNANRAVLVIDEINRGNLSKLLGELVYALEYRGSEVTLPFPRQSGPEKGRRILIIPRELFVIATMNSSDRSIGHIDIAVRRRFGMVRVGTNSDVVLEMWGKDRFGAEGEAYAKQLVGLMEVINKHLGNQAGHDGAELGVGQSYFLPDDENMEFQEAKKVVQNRWKYQVHPLLAEYDVMFGVPLPEHLKDEDLDTVLRALEGRGEAAATS